ncbi:hypothetical protein KXW98_005894 [Aspergillus fumigatus]|uniref:Uncharacterized protein n=1 Tax=Aspergillus fumigatus TaxID=746128 RepID=A0A229XCX1_ASPFM|nr:hypothetical protein CNMCM8714_005460 [Aspergillus fumigatus]KMK56678.1 GPI anchored glycoprotein, putative [Aspergillus fumigatus Z5]KAF4254353.1 hypothetical protein CNMCM8057_005268 [Aspergillus fumigatus]KAF4260680.1 hypothetical protein CNMCM8812_005362 [Aspergillus fumigatus]KAF4295778.1 hypothetical protein CNMCM8686_005847 [Aspergillus fumigatus]
MRSNAIRSLTLLTATVATAAAESTVSLFLPYVDTQSLVAEVLGSSASATTYRVNCVSAGDDCGIPSSGFTVIQGASTVQQAYTYDDYNVAFGCNLGGTTSISCLVSQTDSTTTHVTATAMITDIGSFFLPVVVTGTATAGAHATTGASVTGATPSATGQTTLATSGPSVTSGPQATGSSASASATPSHSSSGNAAIPQITGNANWAIGGAAMAMALALA